MLTPFYIVLFVYGQLCLAGQEEPVPPEHKQIEELPKEPPFVNPNLEHESVEEVPVAVPFVEPPEEHDNKEEVPGEQPFVDPPQEHESIQEVLNPAYDKNHLEHVRVEEVADQDNPSANNDDSGSDDTGPEEHEVKEEVLGAQKTDACHDIPRIQRERVIMKYHRRDLAISMEPSNPDLPKVMKGSEEELTASSDVTINLASKIPGSSIGLPSWYCVQVKCAQSVVFRTDAYTEKAEIEWPETWTLVEGPAAVREKIEYVDIEIKHAGSDCGELKIRKLKYKGCLQTN